MKSTAKCQTIFEDNFLSARHAYRGVLTALSYEVIACENSFVEAMKVHHTNSYDFAVVDLELHGILAYPIVDRLARRGIPYIIAARVPPLTFRPVNFCSPTYRSHRHG